MNNFLIEWIDNWDLIDNICATVIVWKILEIFLQ